MLKAEHLRKTFGNLVAVDDVSFEVAPGTIMGFVGQNGSGKTTTFRLLLDFLTPEGKGQIIWNGKPLNNQVYDEIGYLPEERGLYEKMTVEEQILYFAKLRGMSKKDISSKIDEWMKEFNVKGKKTDKISSLSKGNQQKVQVIATLIHEPKLIILDEPFSGLDPVNADYLKKGILRLKETGSAIIFSSHNMNNIEELCDSMIMIHNGKQVLYGPVQEVRQQFGKTKLLLAIDGWDSESLQAIEGVKSVVVKGSNKFELQLENEEVGKLIYDQVVQGKFVEVFHLEAPTLEEIFKMKVGETHE